MAGRFVLSSNDSPDFRMMALSSAAIMGLAPLELYGEKSDHIEFAPNIMIVANPLDFINGRRMNEYLSDEDIQERLELLGRNAEDVSFASKMGTVTLFSNISDATPRFLDRPALSRGAQERLSYISQLKENWDGFGGKTIDQRTVGRAVEFIEQCLRKNRIEPNIVPMSVGGIQLEWFAAHVEIEVEIHPEGKSVVLIENMETGETDEFPIEDEKRMARLYEALSDL